MDHQVFIKFGEWLAQAGMTEPNDPNAMTLATVSGHRPAARIVLLKAWDENGFVFYTNLESRKSVEIAANPHAALLFHWKSLRRQIRIEGALAEVSAAEADAYYATRPRGSQLGAWASAQSRVLESRAVFEARLAAADAKYAGEPVPRPAFWSGWRLTPDYFEFWQDMEFRLHDRQVFTRAQTGWEHKILYP